MQGFSSGFIVYHLPPRKSKNCYLEYHGTEDFLYTLYIHVYTKHTVHVTEISCLLYYLCIIVFVSIFFASFSQKELKYRHEVVSVEQINKKIGIQ